MTRSISYYENLIKEKRKKTSFREFVKELGCWETMSYYKNRGRISRYPDTLRTKNLGDAFWEDAPSYGVEYEHSIGFFKQFQELHGKIPLQYFMHFGKNENSEYADFVFGCKNVYLSSVIGYDASEVAYSMFCYQDVHDVYNSFFTSKNVSNIYNSGGVTESYNIFYSRYITGSSDIWFSSNLIGCHHCIGCDNLENQSYAIGNIVYEKTEFEKRKGEILREKQKFSQYYGHVSKKSGVNFGSENVEGSYIVRSSNIHEGAWIIAMHDAEKNIIGHGGNGSKNFIDTIDTGLNSHDFTCVIGGGNKSENIYCSSQIDICNTIYYSYFMQNSHHCFGCIGLKNASYCILNKQYSKDEWEEKVCEIFASMEADETIGEFFPASMNPFYFNDTLAYLIDDSFTKEEVEKDGYLWRDEPIRADIPEGVRVVKNTELDQFEKWTSPLPSPKGEGGSDSPSPSEKGVGDEVWYIDPEVMNIVITDEKGNYYRIIEMEYEFLMKHGLPLPRMHWLDRMKMGFR